MQRLRTVFCTGFLALSLAVTLSSCRRNSDIKPADKADVGNTKAVADSIEATDVPAETTKEPTPSAATSSKIKAEDVQAITGIAYDTSNQPVDLPNIKHWEFRMAADSVSLLIATGSTAADRMKQSKLVKHTALSGIRDEAIWEPIQGRLTVLDGQRCAEVCISKSHGDEAKRIEMATALATLVFDKP